LYCIVCKVVPAFGTEEEDLRRLYDLGVVPYSDDFTNAKSRLLTLARQVRDSTRDGALVSVLVQGAAGSGKTAIMANVALEAGFAYVKLVSPDQLILHHQGSKVAKISQVFEDAYKTPLAMIVIDDVERLLEYASVKASVTFSNMVLQALMVLLKRRPPSKCRLMVMVSTSMFDQMQLLHLDSVFHSVVGLPMLSKPGEFKCVLEAAGNMDAQVADTISKSMTQAMTIKGLLNAVATASHECPTGITVAAFLSAVAMAPMHGHHTDHTDHMCGTDE
jgi:vesicle-fusing ATPase